MPIRPTFWNVPCWAEVLVYVFGIAAVLYCAWGIVKNYRLWTQHQSSLLAKGDSVSFSRTFSQVFIQEKIRQTPIGKLHFVLFWGFLILFLGTVLATVDWDVAHLIFGQQFLVGDFYLGYKLFLDLAGLAILIAIALADIINKRRGHPISARIQMAYTSLIGIIITGYLVEGVRLAVQQPDWAQFSPVGKAIANLLLLIFQNPEALGNVHFALWLFHGAIALLFVGSIPYTFFSHLYRTSTHLHVNPSASVRTINPIDDIEEQESFGLHTSADLSSKQRLGFDACTECGRCNAVCPAVKADTPLSPREAVLSIKAAIRAETQGPVELDAYISKAQLWSCTTCGACTQACPVGIDLPSVLVGMRRRLALEEGDFPEGVATTLENIASVGNPWGLDPGSRLDWTKGLDVPVIKENTEVEYLYWVGCAASYDPRSQKIAKAMVKIFNAAHLSFAVMQEERCHGEMARRLGEEYLYQTALEENRENLSRYRFKKIVTACPHCFNTLKNEYPQFDNASFEVLSHVELIDSLLKSKALTLKENVFPTTVLHDSCYLARHNKIVNEPRNILKETTAQVMEAPQNGCQTLCCGAGGGSLWMENKSSDQRMNVIRLTSLKSTGADQIAVTCPHCLSMLESADREKSTLVLDIAEIVAQSLA